MSLNRPGSQLPGESPHRRVAQSASRSSCQAGRELSLARDAHTHHCLL